MPPQRVLECADEMNDVVTSMVDRIRYMRDTHGQDNVLPNLPNEMYNFALEGMRFTMEHLYLLKIFI